MADKVSIVTKIDRQLRQKFKIAAAQNDVRMGDLIMRFIEGYMSERSQNAIPKKGKEEKSPLQFPLEETNFSRNMPAEYFRK